MCERHRGCAVAFNKAMRGQCSSKPWGFGKVYMIFIFHQLLQAQSGQQQQDSQQRFKTRPQNRSHRRRFTFWTFPFWLRWSSPIHQFHPRIFPPIGKENEKSRWPFASSQTVWGASKTSVQCAGDGSHHSAVWKWGWSRCCRSSSSQGSEMRCKEYGYQWRKYMSSITTRLTKTLM